MIVWRISKAEMRKAGTQPAASGSRARGCKVVSKANTIEAKSAREAPANIAAMPMRAATLMSTPAVGNSRTRAAPIAPPIAPPIVNNGASVPPEVPLASEIDQDKNFYPGRSRLPAALRVVHSLHYSQSVGQWEELSGQPSCDCFPRQESTSESRLSSAWPRCLQGLRARF